MSLSACRAVDGTGSFHRPALTAMAQGTIWRVAARISARVWSATSSMQ